MSLRTCLRSALRFGVTLWIALTLSACSISPKQTKAPGSPIDWQQHQQKMLGLSQWQLSGKLAIRVPGEAVTAHIKWQQQDEAFDIRLSGFLGQGAVHLQGTPSSAQLAIAGRGEFTTDNPSRLLFEQTGWSIPVDQLPYWVRGVAAPETSANTLDYRRDDLGRLAQLNQSGWQTDYLTYRQIGGLWLPRKIKLHRGDASLILVIKSWKPSMHEGAAP